MSCPDGRCGGCRSCLGESYYDDDRVVCDRCQQLVREVFPVTSEGSEGPCWCDDCLVYLEISEPQMVRV